MSANSIDCHRALEIVQDIAGAYGENYEEQFPRRIEAEDSDETLAGLANGDQDELNEMIRIRDLWRALETVKMILEQKGCEAHDRAVTDGHLTTLMDVVIFG